MSPSVGTVRQETELKLVAKITPKDIQNGVRGSTTDDPVARALGRAAEAHGISVADLHVIGQQAEMWAWGFGNDASIDYIRFEAARPTHAIEFVVDYDDGIPVKPTQITFIAREIIRGRLD